MPILGIVACLYVDKPRIIRLYFSISCLRQCPLQGLLQIRLSESSQRLQKIHFEFDFSGRGSFRLRGLPGLLPHVKKISDSSEEVSGSFDQGRMAALFNFDQPGVRHAGGELAAMRQRHETVFGSPDDEGGNRNALQLAIEPLGGRRQASQDRPDGDAIIRR